jgi:hypothetical protein
MALKIVLEDSWLSYSQNDHAKQLQTVSCKVLLGLQCIRVVLEILPHVDKEVSLCTLQESLFLRASAQINH